MEWRIQQQQQQSAPCGNVHYVVRYRSTYRPDYGVREKRGGVVLMR